MSRTRRWLLVALMAAIAGGAVSVYVYRIVLPKEADLAKGNSTIVFYGRIVDAAGRPIAGATVDFRVAYSDHVDVPLPFARDEKHRLITTTTDYNGDFSLSGTSGYGFTIANMRHNGQPLEFAGSWQRTSFSRDRGDLDAADIASKRKVFQMKLPSRATASTQEGA